MSYNTYAEECGVKKMPDVKGNFETILEKIKQFEAEGDMVEIEFEIPELIDSINTKDDFIKFLNVILDNYTSLSVDWENKSLFEFIEAFKAVTGSIDNYYQSEGVNSKNEPSWRTVAKMLWVSTVYE
jgi:hypothetical protein